MNFHGDLKLCKITKSRNRSETKYHMHFIIFAELSSVTSHIIIAGFAGEHDAISETVHTYGPICTKRSSNLHGAHSGT